MKKLFIAASILMTVCASAQTNSVPNLLTNAVDFNGFIQEIWDAGVASTNAAIVAGGGHSVRGKNWLAFGAYLYNMSDHVAILLAGDNILGPAGQQASVLRGGLQLKERLYPFQRWGNRSFFTTVYAFDAVATPLSGTRNNGGLANVAGMGADFNWDIYRHQLLLHVGVVFENRSGQGWADGNYAGVYGGLSYGNRGAYGN